MGRVKKDIPAATDDTAWYEKQIKTTGEKFISSIEESNAVIKNETIAKLKITYVLSCIGSAIFLLIAGLIGAMEGTYNALIVCLIGVIINIVLPVVIIKRIDKLSFNGGKVI
jgi:hypothetical protein